MKNIIRSFLYFILPFLRTFSEVRMAFQNKIYFSQYIHFLLSKNKGIYWPVHKNSEVIHPENIFVGKNSNIGTRPGCYIQGDGGLYFGNYVRIASNVGIISGNHDLYDHSKHNVKPIYIDDYCWVGMNSVIMPGVKLGPRTIVGAGSVVTKSFPEGYCVIGGNPAKVIKNLDKSRFVPPVSKKEFYGFVPENKFDAFSKTYLKGNLFFKG